MINPYIPTLLVPLFAFLVLMTFRVDPDAISLLSRIYAFVVLGYVGARYVGRAPVLMWQRNTSPEARNVVGWGIAVIGLLSQVAYGWLYIAYDRPVFLSSQYWSGGIVVLVAVGLTIVASSIPKFPPFGDGRNGLSESASIAVVVVSALGVFLVSHAPAIWGMIRGLFNGIMTAV